MNGAAITVEDSSLGQDVGAGAYRTDIHPAPRRFAEPRDNPLVGVMLDVEPAADDDGVMIANRIEIAIDHGENAIRCRDRLAVDRMHGPLVEGLLRRAVGEPQRLDGRSHRHHGEFRNHDEGEGLRPLVGLVAEHRLKRTPTAIGSANIIIRRFCLSASCRGAKGTPRLEGAVASVLAPVGNSHALARFSRHVRSMRTGAYG